MISQQLIAERYRIIRPLRSKAMAKTFLALDTHLDMQVVVKLLEAELEGDPRIEELVRKQSKLDGRCLVTPTNHGVDALRGQPFLVWPYVEGEDLQRLNSSRDFLPAEQSYALLAQFVDAVATLHRAGLCHGGLKPRYLLIDGAAEMPVRLRLLNSGISGLRAPRQDRKGGRGSPLWMAPELTQPDTSPTALSDVWSMGLVTFFLLTGRSYFRHAGPIAATPLQQLREVMMDALVPASDRASTDGRAATLPRGFDDWFARCVTRDVAQRFKNAMQAQAALQTLLLSSAAMPRESAAPSGGRSFLGPIGLSLAVLVCGGLAYHRGHSVWNAVEQRFFDRRDEIRANSKLETPPAPGSRPDVSALRVAPTPPVPSAERTCKAPAHEATSQTRQSPSDADDACTKTAPPHRASHLKPPPAPGAPPSTLQTTEQRQCELGSRRACQTLVVRLRKGCTSGHDADCTRLGILFLEGHLLPRDVSRAAMLLSRACRNGEHTACARLGQLTPLDGPPAQVPHPEHQEPPREAPPAAPVRPLPRQEPPLGSGAQQGIEV